MSFDPNIPAEHTDLDAAEMRAQFNALKALIDGLRNDLTSLSSIVTVLQSQVNFLQTQFTPLLTDTPHNPNTVSDLAVGLSQPPNQWEVQPIIDKINELLNALRR